MMNENIKTITNQQFFGDYLAERERLFADNDIAELYEGAKQFNRDKCRR
jgi:hypothetical protein